MRHVLTTVSFMLRNPCAAGNPCDNKGTIVIQPHGPAIDRASYFELVQAAPQPRVVRPELKQFWRRAQHDALELLNCDPPAGLDRLPHLCCWFARQGELWRF